MLTPWTALCATLALAAPEPRELDLRHQVVELSVDGARGELSATTTLTLEPLRPDLVQVRLDGADLRVLEASVDGEKTTATTTADSVLVVLPRPHPAVGTPLAVQVRYQARPRRGLHVVNTGDILAYTQNQPAMTRAWLPTLDRASERATFAVSVTLPAGMGFYGTGRVAADAPAGAGLHKVTRVVDSAVPPYLVSLVLARLQDVPLESGAPGVRAVAHVPAGRAADAKEAFAELPQVLASLEKWTGTPYPFPTLEPVVLPHFPFAGMENVAAPTLDAAVLPEPGLAREDAERDLWVHEVAHQWFGVRTVVADERDLWIQEGLATYLAYLVDEDRRGVDEARADFLEFNLGALESAGPQGNRALAAPPEDDPEAVFDEVTYSRGALLFHMVRGQLGDAAFTALLRVLLLERGGGVLDQGALLTALREVTGARYDGWLEAWTQHPGKAALAIWVTQDARTGSTLFRVVQERPPRPLWTTLSVGSGRDELRVPLALTREETVFTLPGVRSVDWAVVDDEGWLLATPPRLDAETSLRALRAASRAQTRAAAAHALAPHVDGPATPVLLAALRSDPSALVRSAAAASLAKAAAPEATEGLVNALKDVSPRVQAEAARALCHRGDVNTARTLAKVAGAPGRLVVREAAGLALGCHVKEAADLVDRALRLKSARSRVEAAVLHGVSQEYPAHPLLLEALKSGDSPRVLAAAENVARDPAGTVVPLLVRRLADPDPEVRAYAADALLRLGAVEAVPALRHAEGLESVGPTRLSMKRAALGLTRK